MELFQSLLAPISVEDFFSTYWRKQCLFSVKNTNYEDILSLDELNEYFSKNELSNPLMRMLGNGSEIELSRYQLDANNTFHLLNKEAVFKIFNEGNTIVIQAAHFQFNNLNKFVKNLEEELGMDVNANIYITPSNSQGFYPHFDTHEVLVLQLSGTKNWNLYDVPRVAPVKGWGLTHEERQNYLKSEPEHKITLGVGDLLYVPRGVVHDAYSDNEMSIHITFGFNPLLGTDLMAQVSKKIEHTNFFREPVFQMNKVNDIASIKDSFKSKLNDIVDSYFDNYSDYKNDQIKYFDTKNLFADIYLIDSLSRWEELSALQLISLSDSNENNLTENQTWLLERIKESKLDGSVIPDFPVAELKISLKNLLLQKLIAVDVKAEENDLSIVDHAVQV